MLFQGKYRLVASEINNQPIYFLKIINNSVITLNNWFFFLSVLFKFRQTTVIFQLKTRQSRLCALKSAIALDTKRWQAKTLHQSCNSIYFPNLYWIKRQAVNFWGRYFSMVAGLQGFVTCNPKLVGEQR